MSGFDEFWDAYPHRDGRKRNKAGALKRYRAHVKAGASEQAILAAARRLRDDPRVVKGYARDPTTWLNQRGWEDEALTANSGLDSKLEFLATRLRNGHRLYPEAMTVELTEGLIRRGDLTREAAARMGLPLAADPIRRTG